MRCPQCGHDHEERFMFDLGLMDEELEIVEWMCIWCIKGEYGKDPLGDYTKAEPWEG